MITQLPFYFPFAEKTLLFFFLLIVEIDSLKTYEWEQKYTKNFENQESNMNKAKNHE